MVERSYCLGFTLYMCELWLKIRDMGTPLYHEQQNVGNMIIQMKHGWEELWPGHGA